MSHEPSKMGNGQGWVETQLLKQNHLIDQKNLPGEETP